MYNHNDTCPFCSKKKEDFFLENEDFAAICSASPILPGHSLIIPKNHRESIFDLDVNQLADFVHLGREAASLLGDVFATESFDFFVQEKKPAGQSVPHLHLHIVPRIKGDFDEPGDWYPQIQKSSNESKGYQLPEDQLLDITQRLKVQANKR